MRLLSRVLLLAAFGMLALPGTSQEKPERSMPRPMPEFKLTALDGSSVESQKLPALKKWLLIYVKPDCSTCDKVLNLVRQDKHPGLPPLMMIVVGGATADQVKDMMKKYPDLAGASWYADPDNDVSTALKLPGFPVIFGVRERTLAWQMMGMISPDPLQMTNHLVSWCK